MIYYYMKKRTSRTAQS